MAILELIKMQEIIFRQEKQFGAIFVKRRPEKEREPAVLASQEPRS
jgi:chromatin segregation and condensation protein Rec8/ScpA/Scc1 (kleisin family)